MAGVSRFVIFHNGNMDVSSILFVWIKLGLSFVWEDGSKSLSRCSMPLLLPS